MKIEIEVTDEQLKQIQSEGQLLSYLEDNLKLRFPSLWSHIYEKGHVAGEDHYNDQVEPFPCGCC